MLGAMYFSMMADVTPEQGRSVHPRYTATCRTITDDTPIKRSKVNMFFETVQQIFEFVIAGSGALLLAKNLYLPFQVGIPLTILVLPILYFAPETLPQNTQSQHNEDTSSSPMESARLLPNPADSVLEPVGISTFPTHRQTVSWKLWKLPPVVDFTPLVRYLRTPGILPIFVVYFVEVLNRGTYAHILQYMSNRFNCTIAEAARVASIMPIFKIMVLVGVVPSTIAYLERQGWSRERIDATIVTASLGAAAVGSVVVAVCGSWSLLILG
jgi:hypothetical protein